MCKFPTFVTFHYIFNVSLLGKYPIITFHYIFQCPIMCKFPIYLHFIISLVSHFGQVPYLFTFHYIFSVPLCASSPSIRSLSHYTCFHYISLVSHSGQVPHSFTFHYFFSVPLCACSLSFYISLYIQCPIVCEYPIILCFIICSVSHYVQVLHLFTIHYIFSVPFWASTLQLYVSLFLQCPIMCMFPIFLHFIIYLVSHYVQVPYHFMFHYIFSVPLCASSLLLLHFIIFLMVSLLASTLSLRLIISFACHYVQVPYLFIIISLVSHFGQSLSFTIFSVPLCACSYLFTFHYIFSVPLCASTPFYVSLYLQCPIMCKFPTFVTFHYIFNGLNTSKYPMITFNYIFHMSLCASSLSIYISLDLQCPIMCKFSIFFLSSYLSVSHFGQVPYLFTFHQIFQCPILGKFPIYLHSIRSLVSHFGQVPYFFSLSIYISLYF